MSRKLRMQVEAVLAVVCGILTVAAVLWPTWIESLVEASPDNGSGSAERLLALAWLAGTLLFAWLARRDAVHLRAQIATDRS